ncbi:MAG: peptide chain release factor 2 [Clostridiales bacterium]|nr:peptide chain release factor 2 [Clostridiales bacterium]
MILSRSVFDPESLKIKIEELKELQLKDGFFNDPKQVSKVGRELKSCEHKLEKVLHLKTQIENCEASIELLEEIEDDSIFAELCLTLESLEKEVEGAKLETLLSGKYDDYNAILTLHAGAGGTEAQDWTEMLYRMYTMYAEKNGFKIKVLDVLDGEEAGIKSITFLVSGEYAYGYLKAEKGVHRLVRISPFDSNARRHTSFASLEVMPEIDDAPDIIIRPEDLKVDTFRASGAGGQHVNKTESAIRITHVPTGIIVACQTERSQIQNRETAMKMLYSKLVEKQELEEMEKLASIRGDLKKIEWGSQIRSYVFCPYTLVKDHRTNFENSDVQAVMDGNIQEFINEYLKRTSVKN